MLEIILVVGSILCAIQAIRTQQLLTSAIWLAALSALSAIWLYALGSAQVAVVELSVGAGLVTVLFVFAISFANDGVPSDRPLVPRPIAWGLPLAALVLIGILIAPLPTSVPEEPARNFATVLWQERSLDVLVQVSLIFAGALGVVGLLAERERAAQETATARMASQILKYGSLETPKIESPAPDSLIKTPQPESGHEDHDALTEREREAV